MGGMGFQWPAASGAGEVRRVERNLPIAIMGSLFVYYFETILSAVLCYNIMGYDFIHGLAYLSTYAPDKYPISIGVYPPTLVALTLTKNMVLRFLIAVGWVFGVIWPFAISVYVSVRNMFAWSFDRVIPVRIADVSERLHIPLNCVLITGLLSWIFFLLFTYTPFYGYFVNATVAASLAFALVGVGGVIFPYVRKDLFEGAPSIVKKRVAGIPLMSIYGAITAIVFFYLLYVSATLPALGGEITWFSIVPLLALWFVSIPIYYAAKAYRKKQGIDLGLIFKEIPPE
jgi:amino acid transporter